jgi:hypothetical protein
MSTLDLDDDFDDLLDYTPSTIRPPSPAMSRDLMRRGLLENALKKLAEADEIVMEANIAGGEVSMKFRRNSPRVSHQVFVDKWDFEQGLNGKDGDLFSVARNVKRILDDKQKAEKEKHSSVTSRPSPTKIDAIAERTEALKAALEDTAKATKKAAATTEEVAKALSSLDDAFKDEPVTGATSDTYDEIIKGIAAANRVCIPGLKDQEYVAEFDASVTGASWSPVNLDGGSVVTFDRVVFYERIARVIVQVRGPDAETFMVAPEDMDDLLPDLSLAVDQAVAENSTFGSLVKLNNAAKTLVAGKPAFARALAEATIKTVSIGQEKAVATAKDEVTSYYERNTAYGLI